MKTLTAVAANPQADIAAADLAMQIKALFAACPSLCGFVVEELSELQGDAESGGAEDALAITQISFDIPCSRDESHQVCSLVASAVAELVAAQPEAYALLRGRTFARTLH